MNKTKLHRLVPLLGTLATALLALACAAAQAATASPRSERDPAAYEAASVRAELARHKVIGGESPAVLRANALLRCQVHEGEARTACEALVRGEGRETGSVRSGGVLREIVTRSVGGPGAPAAPAATARPVASSR